MSFLLSSALNTESIKSGLSAQGYVQVPGILPEENANRIHKSLLEQTPWNLVFTDRGKHIDLAPAQLEAMRSHDTARLHEAIYAQARDRFQYCYNNYPIYDAHKAGLNKGHILHEFYEWLNEDEFLRFARRITGFDDISFVDAQATRYVSGHFLTTHDDSQEGKNRRAAYIFNFTHDWRADWGGYLQILDEDGNVRRGLRPVFNALNVLAVPQKHNVSLVAPFAGGMRLAITGWFRCGNSD